MAKGNKPDYEIKALNKATRQSVDVGVAWLKSNPEGSVSIHFNEFVDLNQLRRDEVIVTVFPIREK